ncbi:DUF4142 domain-containing protein [Hymenobacter weizhouensis]|uniref:DUF4142 domain-containing protein n=1 Tax=Hymenobacter sp. YIM 151500-1 TaxID=2987689 RepID=UPI0022279102|nr:DUF4142 domain-containing protein [Hymenobacter sp. YIM 151500-1]UYZ62058.1 DUF4142 domain-containing protein [Hymenobacter sp. YIM 151500-1]
MKRIILSVACLGLLSLGACNTSNTDTAGATTATDTSSGRGNGTPDAAETSGTSSTAAATDATTPSAANTDDQGPTAPHSTDEEFMKSAAHSDQNEIQLSKLALEKGVTGMAKDHANMMIKDHTKSTADLKAVAQKKGVTLPTDMDEEHKAIATSMRALSGKEFEKKFMDQMVLDHQKTVNTMKAHLKMTQDADLQGFINKTTPVVQSHLDMSKKHAAMM